MALPGELKGLDGTACDDCQTVLKLAVCRSSAGFYLGYSCDCCGPFSRETDYFFDREDAWIALDAYLDEGTVPSNIRTTGFSLSKFGVTAAPLPESDPEE